MKRRSARSLEYRLRDRVQDLVKPDGGAANSSLCYDFEMEACVFSSDGAEQKMSSFPKAGRRSVRGSNKEPANADYSQLAT